MSDLKLKYKDLEFEVRLNRLGITKELYPLILEINKLEYEATKYILKNEDYQLLCKLSREYGIYSEDLKEMEQKLEANPDDENTKAAIEQNKKNIAQVTAEMASPELIAIAEIKMGEEMQVRLDYIYKPEVLKKLFKALLKGEVEKIDYENQDDDYWELADKIIEVFFCTKELMKKNVMKL